MAMFLISAFFMIVAELRSGRIIWSLLLPKEVRVNIRRLARSELWVSLMNMSEYDNIKTGDCSTRAVSRGDTDELLSTWTEVDGSDLDLLDLPPLMIGISRKVKVISMRESDHEGEGMVTHESLQEMIKSRSKKRLPYASRNVLSNLGDERWSWNLHNHALRWPVLENVLEIPHSKVKKAIPSGHVFVNEERDNSLLTYQAQSMSQRPGASMVSHVREMFTLDFLSQDEKILDAKMEARGHYYYDCNYRVYEGIVGGNVEANLLSRNSSFSWKSFAFSEMSNEAAEELSRQGIDMSPTPDPRMWLLPAGTAMQLRYSESHIMRLQLTGSAQYTLFPPSALPSLSLFPTGHVSRWQSQVQLYDPDPLNRKAHFPLFQSWQERSESMWKFNNNNAALKVTLSPGDVLYVPPFWGVHSEAVKGISTVLDVPSLSADQLALVEAWHMRLPLQDPALYTRGDPTGADKYKGEEKSPDAAADPVEVSYLERVVAAKVYLVHILSRCPSLRQYFQSPRHFARRLYQGRYKAMYTPNSLFMKPYKTLLSEEASSSSSSHDMPAPSLSGFQCFREREGEVIAAVARLNSEYLISRAEFVASCVEDPAVPPGAKLVWMEGYAERVAAWAMAAGLDSASASKASDRHEGGLKFLLSCLDQDGFVEVEEEGGSIHLDTNTNSA